MNNCNHKALLKCAVAAARAAGDHALSQQHRRKEADEIKDNDVKLVLDRECQKKAEEVILDQFSDHAILGEEGRTDIPPDSWTWIIDPIDGTVNYFHGLDWWCSSVAVALGPEVRAGAVYIPSLDHMYTATLDGPAQLNGKPIQTGSPNTLARAMISTGLSRSTEPGSPTLGMFSALGQRVQKIRLMGAAAIDVCHVAAGKIDGYYETSIFWWDIAAAGLIAERAGANTIRLEEYEDYRMRYMAAAPSIYDEFQAVYCDVAGSP